MKLYTNHVSPNGRRASSVLGYLGLPAEVIQVDMAKGAHKAPEFLAINPNGKIPTLDDEGFHLWESNAIMAYLAGKAGSDIMPAGLKERADTERWMFWQVAHMGPAMGKLAGEFFFKKLFGGGDPDMAVVKKATEETTGFATVLEAQLNGSQWVTGKLSVADFGLGQVFGAAHLGRFSLEPFPNITAWLERVSQLKGWVSAPAPKG